MVIALLICFVAWQFQLALHWLLIVIFSLFIASVWYIASFKRQVMRAFTRATLHVDAISQQDYNQFSKSPFSQGKVKLFHQQLKVLSERLQQHESNHDQQAFLVFQLVGHLDSPVMVINEKQQLTFANAAFYHLFNQSWQMLRFASAEFLGLEFQHDCWRFIDINKHSKWQIQHSEFIQQGLKHQLLVFTDLEPALRESQLTAWQKIIAVLGHEIRNSLAPVSSMAESLAETTNDDKERMILEVITDRCHHLQSFVDRYSSLSNSMVINSQWLSVKHLVNEVRQNLPDMKIELSTSIDQIWGDGELLGQVFINLINNAIEAHATKVKVDFVLQEQFYIIEISDNGHGFANLSNLFVPLYSTKVKGQGIGLSFCRNIIEQHQGVIELHNNNSQGVTVMIILPCRSKLNENEGSSKMNQQKVHL